MNVILRIEMMDAFGVDSVFEGRHRAMMAHTPVSKAATMDSSVLTKAAKPLGVPAPSNCLMRRLRLKAPTWISRRLRMLPRPRKCRRRIAPVSYTWAKDRSTSSARRFCNRWPRELRRRRRFAYTAERQRRGVPFVGVSQTRGDDGLRFQIDRVLSVVRQVRATIFHLRDLGVRVMRVLPVVIGDLLRPTSSCTSTGSRCRMRDNVE